MTRPAKPLGLHDSAKTKAAIAERVANESAMKPRRDLPMDAPARLKGNKQAAAIWRRLMRMYSELDAEIVTRLDLGLLEDYCLTIEELDELRTMRSVAFRLWLEQANEQKELKESHENDQAAYIAVSVVDAFEALIKLDARIDRKKSLLHTLRQSLYLTPRARAGVSPNKKEAPQPVDDLEELINVTDEFIMSNKDV